MPLREPIDTEALRRDLVKELTSPRRGWPGLPSNAAHDAADQLERELRRAWTAQGIIEQARAVATTPRPRDGRPSDWPLRDLEGRALGVLAAYGVPVKVYRDGVAARVLAHLEAALNTHAAEPNDAVRRGVRRLTALRRWVEILEQTGQPPRLVERPARRQRRRAR